jgi:hypothetical protein
MKLDGSPRNAWTVILGTGGRNPPEQMDDFPGICRTEGTEGIELAQVWAFLKLFAWA